MREAKLFDHCWQQAIDSLFRGESVFLFASEFCGKQTFQQYVRNSQELSTRKRMVCISNLRDTEPINYQEILNLFQVDEQLTTTNKVEFVNALESLIQKTPFLVLIANTFRSYKVVSTLVEILHEIILKYPNGNREYLTVLLTDDYSLYYYELQRRLTNEYSASWFFFKKIYVRQIADSSLINEELEEFFHNKQLAEELTSIVMNLSGGHQGIVAEAIDHLVTNWKSINFDLIARELGEYIATGRVMDSLRNELVNLNNAGLTYLYSFRTKRMIESDNGEQVKRWHTKGILAKSGDMYIGLCDGVVRELVINTYNSKVMGNKKKLILCIHGLNGSEETWSAFKALYESDSELKEAYDFDTYTFPTTMRWELNFFKATNPPIAQLAAGLRTEIETRFSPYGEISLVCHSLGGLVGRKMLLEHYLLQKHGVEMSEGFPKMEKIIMYATPNNGSGLANAAKYLTIRNRQVRQLCRKAEFLQELNEKWMQLGAHDHYKGWYVIGGKDQVVSPDSVAMYWGNSRCKTIIGVDHFDIVKPTDQKSLSYLLFKKILLEEN
ncbi:esterase/lipase family protein [Foetidibacter luteolus]|uniref:esterase/lipase family protein n=1 Tax=Foetidibacter luteolus TaxID=2608880 RepID=UPI00129B84FA|nr:hypothetical protein [Foetidibacter luteolus]